MRFLLVLMCELSPIHIDERQLCFQNLYLALHDRTLDFEFAALLFALIRLAVDRRDLFGKARDVLGVFVLTQSKQPGNHGTQRGYNRRDSRSHPTLKTV